MNIHIINIGDEILIGQIVNTNATWMAQQLNLAGFKVTAIKIISDGLEDIQYNIEQSFKEVDIVITTGGLGATKDDITKKAIAQMLGVEMYFDESVYNNIERMFKKRNIPLNHLHKEQSMMPKGVELLENKMGTAPGMHFKYKEKSLFSTAGVPYEMQYVMTNGIVPNLQKQYGKKAIYHHTIKTSGKGETQIQELINDIEEGLPSHIKIAYLPNLGEVRLRISAFANNGQTQEDLEKEVQEVSNNIHEVLNDIVYSHEDISIQEALGNTLKEKGKTLALAESCTGGNIMANIVQIAGSSSYFEGGMVAYSNEIKMQKLGVKQNTLETHGAVSEQTVREMVEGAIAYFGVDVALSVSGIAGPSGGTKEKPVGTIWLAVGNAQKIETSVLRLGKNRQKNIEYTTKRALNMLRMFVLDN